MLAFLKSIHEWWTRERPEVESQFHYNDKVRITKGFYEGSTGYVKEYKVNLFSPGYPGEIGVLLIGGRSIWITPSHLEKIES